MSDTKPCTFCIDPGFPDAPDDGEPCPHCGGSGVEPPSYYELRAAVTDLRSALRNLLDTQPLQKHRQYLRSGIGTKVEPGVSIAQSLEVLAATSWMTDPTLQDH